MSDFVQSRMHAKSYAAKYWYRFSHQLDLQMMVIPGIVFILIFSYLPMFGLIMAFQNYNVFDGFAGSEWVGFRHFRDFFNSPTFSQVIRNTLVISFLRLLIVFPAPIILALMLHEVGNMYFKRFVQTITYLPFFLSWVIVGTFVKTLLSADTGVINFLFMHFGMIERPILFMSESKYFWSILTTANVWRGTGFGSIVYLAALSNIDTGLYEAASIDGASRLRQIFCVSLPSILPVIIIFLILAIGNMFSAGFEDILQLGGSAAIRGVSDVIDTLVYRVGLQTVPPRFSYATAVGLFRSVLNIILLVFANQMARKSGNSLW